jgi:hypothetical protein
MKRNIWLYIGIIYCFLSLLLFFPGCNSFSTQISKSELPEISKEVLKLIKSADFERLSEYVHKSKGLQFSPYDFSYIPAPYTTKFSKRNVKNFMTIDRHYVWGAYDGSGFDIKLTPKEYYNEFIYDIDYEKMADVVFIGDADSKRPKDLNIDLDYFFNLYPNSTIVHYYYKGIPAIGFCDFKKLTLVFQRIKSNWFLIGIFHGEQGV